MGDRANFGFVQPNGNTIVLYGHWAGYQMLAQLAEAVAKAKPRWNDTAYATRIAVSNLIGDQWNMETGWSCTLIAGSAFLTESVSPEMKTSSQGASDLVMNLSGAGGGALAGVIIGTQRNG